MSLVAKLARLAVWTPLAGRSLQFARLPYSILSVLVVTALQVLLSATSARADFRVCNQVKQEVSVALGYFELASRTWVSAGWFTISPGDCRSLLSGDVRNSNIFAFYEIPGIYKWGGTKRMCVERPGPFRIYLTGSYTCDDSELFFETSTGPYSDSVTNIRLNAAGLEHVTEALRKRQDSEEETRKTEAEEREEKARVRAREREEKRDAERKERLKQVAQAKLDRIAARCKSGNNDACKEGIEFADANDLDADELKEQLASLEEKAKEAAVAAESARKAQEEARAVALAMEADRRAKEEAAKEAARKAGEEATAKKFVADQADCKRGVRETCIAALNAKLATAVERDALQNSLQSIERFGKQQDECALGSVPACDAALAYVNISAEERQQIHAWRDAQSFWSRVSRWASGSEPPSMTKPSPRTGEGQKAFAAPQPEITPRSGAKPIESDAAARFDASLREAIDPGETDFSDRVIESKYAVRFNTAYHTEKPNELIKEGSKWRLLHALQTLGAVKLTYEDHFCAKMFEKGFYPRECVMHDKAEIGELALAILDASKLKIRLFERAERKVVQVEQFPCADGQCVYALHVETSFLSTDGKTLCEFVHVANESLCSRDGTPVYVQVVLVVSNEVPSSWRTIASRFKAGTPFLDEWTAIKALRLPAR